MGENELNLPPFSNFPLEEKRARVKQLRQAVTDASCQKGVTSLITKLGPSTSESGMTGLIITKLGPSTPEFTDIDFSKDQQYEVSPRKSGLDRVKMKVIYP